jgi:uncharacterized protein YndB with AHSA1/START domain
MTTSTITVSRAVPGSPDQVFAAWVEADRLAAWWWPQLAVTTYDVDARVTLAHTSAEHAPDGGAEQGWSDVMDRLSQSTSSRS